MSSISDSDVEKDQSKDPVEPRIRADVGFSHLLGYRRVSVSAGRAEVELDVLPEHLNAGGVLHGGVLMTLLDVACASSGAYCSESGRMRRLLTLTMTTTFTAQCSTGTIRAVGNCKASGRRIFNSTGEIFDDKGRLLAMGEGTFRYRSDSDPLKKQDT